MRAKRNGSFVMEEVKGRECRACNGADLLVQRTSDGRIVVTCPLCEWQSVLAFSMSADRRRGYLEPVAQVKG